ncbi:MAG: choice-of-anchor Q domain-containing protein [Thermoanaerobaculia bacterium]
MMCPSTCPGTARRLRRALVIPSLVLLTTLPAGAATLTVDTTGDELDPSPNGACSLREAVESANRDADFGGCVGDGAYGDDTIVLPAGDYRLTRTPGEDFLDLDNSVGDLDVLTGGALEILGAGSAGTVIEAAGSEPFGVLQAGTSAPLRLVDLTVAGGERVAGAGVFAEAELTLERVVVRDNVARGVDAGGAGIVSFAALTLIDTLVSANVADLEDPCDVGPPSTGGGVLALGALRSGGSILIERSTISDNTVTGDPDCEGLGGGLGIVTDVDPVRLVNSTVSGNSAPFGGGIDLVDLDGLFSEALMETKAAGGAARRPRTGRTGSGWAHRSGTPLAGGLSPRESHGPPSLEHVTIAANSAHSVGGLSIVSFAETGEVLIENSLIGANTADHAPDCSRFGVNETSQGVNLLAVDEPLADDVACLSGPPDRVGSLASPLAPRLGPLQDNGGLTPTQTLMAGSPALDAAPDQGEAVDQRGAPRPIGPAFDVGAVEAGSPPPPPGEWLTSPELAGFRAKARITPGGTTPIENRGSDDCIAETLCVAGARPDRSEAFLKVIGPRPNGFFWVQISRFTPSELELWVEQLATGELRYYRLPAVDPGGPDLPGLQDRMAFEP